MNSKAALAKALLKGEVVNIKNGFTHFGITNVPREIGRSIERAFGVEVSRTMREGMSRYKQPCIWCDYRLNKTDYNKEGIQKMIEYVLKQEGTPKTDSQEKDQRKIKEIKNTFQQPHLF